MHHLDKKYILLVDDDAILAINGKIQLEKYGYKVVVANSGEKAVEIVRTVPEIDLILMDIDLGSGMDGTETAALILAEYELPIVFLSSHTEPAVVEKTEKISSYGYVVKNSSITVLDASIKMAFKLFDSNNKVKETKKQVISIIDSTSDLIWSVDPVDFGLIVYNQSLVNYFYVKRNIAIHPGMRPVDLFSSPEPIALWENLYNKAIEQGSWKMEYLTVSGDMILELTLNSIEANGKIIGVSVFGKDITERKQAEESIKEQEARFRDEFESVVLRPDGTHLPVKLAVAPIKLSDKTVSISFISDISDKYAAEEAIRNSEARYRRVIENSFEAITFLDERGVVIYESPSSSRVTGYSIEEMVGINGFAMLHPEDAPRVMLAYRQLVQLPGETVHMEMRTLHKNGIYRDMDVRATNLLHDPAVRAIVVNFSDITNRKQSELGLNKLNDAFLNFSSDPEININMLVAVLGEQLNGTCAFYNRLEEGMLRSVGQWKVPDGYKVLDFPDGHICNDVICSARDGITLLADLQNSIYAVTDPNVKRYGLMTYLGVAVKFNGANCGSLCLVYQNDYQPDGNELRFLEIIASAIGVEESRWRTLNLLKDSEEKFRLLVESMDDIIFSLDKEQRHTGVFGSWLEKLGQTKEMYLGKTAKEILEDSNTVLHETMNREALSGKPVSYEWSLGEGNNQFYINTRLSPLKDAASNIVGVVGIGRDISELKRAEKNIAILLAEKELLLKEVHHRIKNNMNTMMSMLSLQAAACQDTNAARALEDARTRLISMSFLYDKLFKQNNYSELSILEYLSPLIDEILSNFPKTKKITVCKDIQDFLLDVKYIQPIGLIANELITNIMKHAFDGRDSGSIEVAVKKHDGLVTIRFVDNGNGISKSYNHNRETGFGLQLVNALADQLGGTIRIEQDSGTCVALEFFSERSLINDGQK
jgi:PAS domain S-box-containing protein